MKESMENYLETILVLTEQSSYVRSIDIVNEMGFSKPSVSVAVKKLKAANYIEVDSKGYITFTTEGRIQAENVWERHRIIAKALMSIGVSEATAKEDACKIEHDISDETFEMLKKYLQ